MPKLIKESAIVENPWIIVDKDADYDAAIATASDYLLFPLQLWLDNSQAMAASEKHVGVWLDSDQSAEALLEASDLNEIPLIALNFPTFMDGRAYSTAAVIRQHHHYQGELRAIGDVLKDQLSYMKRCGFDSFDVSDEVKDSDALNAFKDFRQNYQSTVEQSEPLFRRR